MPKQYIVTAGKNDYYDLAIPEGPHFLEVKAINGALALQGLKYGGFRLWHVPSGLYARRELAGVNTLRHAKRVLDILAADPGWATVDTREANPELKRLADSIDPAMKIAEQQEQEYVTAYYKQKWARSA